MPDFNVLPDGNLEIRLCDGEAVEIDWDDLTSYGESAAFAELIEPLRANSEWDVVQPEDVGALTDAPIISDGVSHPDSGRVAVWGNVWWFPNYQVTDPIEVLRRDGRVVFEAAPENGKRKVYECEVCRSSGIESTRYGGGYCPTCRGYGMILVERAPGVSEEVL